MTQRHLIKVQTQEKNACDTDEAEATDAQIAQAMPFIERLPALADGMGRNMGGRPKAETPKVAVSLRLDQDVVARFKASGRGWQTRMNRALREAVGL